MWAHGGESFPTKLTRSSGRCTKSAGPGGTLTPGVGGPCQGWHASWGVPQSGWSRRGTPARHTLDPKLCWFPVGTEMLTWPFLTLAWALEFPPPSLPA